MGFQYFCISFLAVLAFTYAAEDAKQPQMPPKPSPEQIKLAEMYFNFTGEVGQMISEILANETLTETPRAAPEPENGALITSILGIVHILSTFNEQPMSKPTAIPTFEKLLKATPKKLPEAYELLMGTLDKNEKDLIITSQLYSSEEIKMTPALTKLKVELIKSDLKDASKINTQLKSKLASPMEDNYIPDGLSISPAAKALMIDTLHLMESWPVPPTKLPKAKFSGADEVEMFELKGTFGVVEGPEGIEVNIPFQNPKRFISLGLPKLQAPPPPAKEESRAAGSEQPAPPKFLNGTMVRVQLPVFKLTLREPGFDGNASCDFKKEENFLQFLDDVTFISLDSSKLEMIGITGAQISNVADFKKDASSKKDKPTESAPNGSSNNLPNSPTDAPAAAEARKEDGAEKEKLLVFNQPFTFSIIDINIGALFSGSVESLKKPAASKPSGAIFGMGQPLPYLSCL